MSGINERMRQWIAHATQEEHRYKTLEEKTGIARRRWMDFMKGRQEAKADMIEAILIAFKSEALWIGTGTGENPVSNEVSEENDIYREVTITTRGVTLSRDKDGVALTNVPHIINLREPYSPAGYEWGYHGTGPKELAANILYQFGLQKTAASQLSTAFSEQVLSSLPHEKAYLSAQRVKDWINDNRENDNKTS